MPVPKLEPVGPRLRPVEVAAPALAPATVALPESHGAVPAHLRDTFKRFGMGALVVALLAALAVWQGPGLIFGPRIAVDTVVQRDFVRTVVASGHVETPHRVSLGTQIVGTVARVPVSEGQSVRAGQILIELEAKESNAALAQADAAVLQAQARLRQLREVQAPMAQQALRQAQVNVDNARAQWLRSKELSAMGFVGQAALDDAAKVVAVGESQLDSVRSQLAGTRPGGSDEAVATTALDQARAGAAAARSRLLYATVLAPVAGTLIDRAVEPGDVVQPGKALMVLSPEGSTQLVVQIDEKNLQMLAVGEAAQASADAYPDQRFDAELAYINPGVDVQRGSVEVKLDVARPPAYLRQDMTVSVDIHVASRKQAVLVSSDAVHDADLAQPWVLKVDGRRVRRQAVTLGLRSGGVSEVLQGLHAGDRVVPVGAVGISDGSRLRTTAPATQAPPASSASPT